MYVYIRNIVYIYILFISLFPRRRKGETQLAMMIKTDQYDNGIEIRQVEI